MPTSGSPPFTGTNPFPNDSVMPPFPVTNEYDLYDGDDVNHATNTSLFNFAGGGLLDGSMYGESKPFPPGISPPTDPNLNRTAPGYASLPSHRGSSSSDSSRMSGNSTGKTSVSSADAMMTDEAFPTWTVDNEHKQHDTNFMFETLDPSNIDMSTVFDFDSASSSPSPPTNGVTRESSVPINPGSQGHVAKRIKGHHKAQSQHSLTSSMNGLKTSGSRETSPMSNIVVSQEASPAVVFKNSPSPENIANHLNGGIPKMNMAQAWPAMGGLPVNGPVTKIRQDSINIPHGFQSFSPRVSLAQGAPPRLVVHPTPLKSRVETQIPIKLTLHNLPPGVKKIHLPTHTISKPKLLAKPPAMRSPDTLELSTMLVCSSAMEDRTKRIRAFQRAATAQYDFLNPNRQEDAGTDEEQMVQEGGEVRICNGCITRERKRAGRKKHKKPEEEELWNRYEHQRVIVFNTQEVKDWQSVTPHMLDPTGAGLRDPVVPDGTVQVDAPMRIACYCRHHGEKMGFRVIFTIKDYQGNLVAQQISSSIMITDDHKTHIPTTSTAQTSVPALGASPMQSINDVKSAEAPMMFHSQSSSDLQSMAQNGPLAFPPQNPQPVTNISAPRNLSRQGSPMSPSGPMSKKRKASGSMKLPSGLEMTRLETHQSPPSIPGAQNESAATSAATSPFSPNMAAFPTATDPIFHGQPNLNGMGQQFPTGPPTPNSGGAEFMFPSGTRNLSLDSMSVPPMFSAPTSTHPSRAPSPNRMGNDIRSMPQPPVGQNMYNAPTAMNVGRSQPMIYKIIPGEGPKSGGVEVTILGSGFTNGGLEVMFGEQRAATTTYWGETSLVCLLPPSPSAGVVPVSIRQPGVVPQHHLFTGNQQPLFRYVDDDEHRLIRTALTVLGNKLGGKMTDVADIARNIIYGPGNNSGSWGPSTSGGQTPNANFSSLEQDLSESVEMGLLRILELIDLDDSINEAKINLKRASGQTMLHLACALGFARFVAGLLSRGANVGVRDRGGFTPLHLAAMNNHPEIVRRLIMKGADPTMRSLSGLTSADVAQSSDVLRVLRKIENHSRSRSNGSLHSRANSASSLKSLWDTPLMTPGRREKFTSGRSRSGSSSAAESSDSDGDWSGRRSNDDDRSNWLHMRQPFPPTHYPKNIPPRHLEDEDATPTSPMSAIRDHFAAHLQQWQNSMAMHFQNLPPLQMPHMQMPALPPIPVLPDYQAYLYATPVVQRISSLVPNIRSPRPGSEDGQSPQDGSSKRWEFPFFGAKDSPPPAYDSIFPEKSLDKSFEVKQTSAATAAVEFEADKKCATLFDQPTTETPTSAEASTSQSQEVPALLEIGRKHNITKEQQEHLQRAHAQRLKTGSSDKMLWFVWIPILMFILGAMLVSVAPSLTTCASVSIETYNTFSDNVRGVAQRFLPNIVGTI
ncbi:uncharacterized protein F4822DRAFT_429386 [Hypoxylon trugodes]|uniref:uncharacterized protein n=1 Tax=Hypoxylon trugodes TaxID=326681 RepID=UPI002192C149|nr:uncharacterized protein F4822DRAFT_429386 [Hypoxylon trugodes]KAI1388771.1 hypothetical protein F4822DRAFT_429386 [Hypoxylon trugodes]